MDLKQAMRERGEWVSMAAAVMLLAGTAAASFVSADSRDRDDVATRTATAAAALDASAPPERAKTDFGRVRKPWAAEGATKPAGAGDWVMSFRPQVVARIVKRDGAASEEKPTRRVLPPAIESPEAELGKVTLRWKPGVRSGVPAAPVDEFEVWRRAPGAEWKRVATLPGKSATWEDSAVEPKATYGYRVRARTKSKTADARAESDFSASIEATLPRATAIIYRGGSNEAARIAVRKHMKGEWHEFSFVVFPRDEPAGHDGAIGGVGRVRNSGTDMMEDADFSTGWTLLAIEKARFPTPFEHDRMRLRYLDEDGVEQVAWMEDGMRGR